MSEYHRPSIGTSRDVLGTLSANMSRNTVNANKTEIPTEIFSPASGGTQNTSNMRMESIYERTGALFPCCSWTSKMQDGHYIRLFSARLPSIDNALYKFTYDIDIDLEGHA